MTETNQTKSSSSKKKWFIGCGIGCGAVILIVIILIIGGVSYFKNIVNQFENTEAMMSEIIEKYGEIREYTPEADGSIDPYRIKLFLSARKSFSQQRESLEKSLAALSPGASPEEIDVKTSKNVFKMIRLGFGLVPEIAEFYKNRNQALLEAGMGLGEYYYIYIISYYSWLKKSPEDGPDFQIIGSNNTITFSDEEDIMEERKEQIARHIHNIILPMMLNQLKELNNDDALKNKIEWKETLKEEIDSMEYDRLRIPWQDGLPEVIENSLRPFRRQLEESYSVLTSPLEVAMD
ncbi:MAG: hypothetical protein ACOC6P_03560 [Candidatus Aminicenantaceae bacterium]